MPSAPEFRSDFLRTFAARGHYYGCTDPEGLDALFQKERVTGYIGFDCTAPSFHIGNLRQLITAEKIEANKQSIVRDISHLLKFGNGPTDAIMIDNAEWLDRLEYVP